MSKRPIPTALSTHDRARLRKGAPTDGAALRRIWDDAYDAYDAAQRAEVPLATEKALAELVDKIAPGLDSGDLLADAREASKRLDTQNAQRMSAICAAASSEDFAFDAVCKSVDEAMRARADIDELVSRLMELADDFAEQAQNDGRQYCLTGDENWSEATWDRRAALQSSLSGAINDGALLIVAHPEMMEALNRLFGLGSSNKATGEQA